MEYIAPIFNSNAFHCPNCNVYAHMNWQQVTVHNQYTLFYSVKCSRCNKSSMWRVNKFSKDHTGSKNHKDAEMIFPYRSLAPVPELDMPDDVKKDYEEAAKVFSKSPRSAAALLRLGLQKLCKHLGENGKNIHDDIRSLAAKNTLPPLVVKVADTVRITGNNAVHPGTMSNEDVDYVASKMFGLLNFIVKKGISEPRELEELYNLTPEAPRKAAEEKDAEAKN